MIEYIANFYGAEKRPYICKKFTASNGEDSHTLINLGNEEDVKELTAELIYEHMQNVLKYVDEKLDLMTIIAMDDFQHQEPWPVKGWAEVVWAQNEIEVWWQYIYNKDYEERYMAAINAKLEAELAAEAETHETQDHTHDPETGEAIPNETTPEETQP
jgi:hypothetical protein